MMKKAISFLLTLLLVFTLALTASAKSPRLVDDADLLSSSEESRLTALLNEISERQEFDVVIVTSDSLDGKSAMAFADDYYDYNDYGYGASYDGALLLVSMDTREWWISTTGFGITAINDDGIDYISEQFLSDLSDGDYADAFETFATLCDDFVTQAKTGEAYDDDHLPKAPFPLLKTVGIALIAGLIIGLITVTVMKRQLRSVRMQPAAATYVRPGSLQISESRDLFLFRNVQRRPRPKSNSSSGGGTHRGSSGRSHGGGGGRF